MEASKDRRRASPVHHHKSQHKTHQSQALSHFSTILFWSRAPRMLAPQSLLTGLVQVRAGQEAGGSAGGPSENQPTSAFLVGTEPGESSAPGASFLNHKQHTASGAADTATVPGYRVGRQWPRPQGAGQGAQAGLSPSCSGKSGCGVSRPHPEWKARPGMLLPPSPAAHGALAEEPPLGCLQQAPLLFLQPKRERAPCAVSGDHPTDIQQALALMRFNECPVALWPGCPEALATVPQLCRPPSSHRSHPSSHRASARPPASSRSPVCPACGSLHCAGGTTTGLSMPECVCLAGSCISCVGEAGGRWGQAVVPLPLPHRLLACSIQAGELGHCCQLLPGVALCSETQAFPEQDCTAQQWHTPSLLRPYLGSWANLDENSKLSKLDLRHKSCNFTTS